MAHADELTAGQRFAFGDNWARFLNLLNEDRVQIAERTLSSMLEIDSFVGKSFLDAGCGSGLFSLAARRLGAKVHSFDYDPKSVACAQALKKLHFADDPGWIIQEGSVLDKSFLDSLGQFDIVYSWGVLHHTGEMYQAIANATDLVREGGKLFISIYNDMGGGSRRWKWIKRRYCSLPAFSKLPFACFVILPGQLYSLAAHAARGSIGAYFRNIANYKSNRGMNWWRDQIDWVGGYPYEYAKPEEIFNFCKSRRFRLDSLTTAGGGKGCNEFVFTKIGSFHESELTDILLTERVSRELECGEMFAPR